MKSLLNIINEKLIITKDTKEKQYINLSLDEFKKVIKDKLDYKITYEDFSHFRNGFLPNNKKTSEAKFTDVTDNEEEFFYYKNVIGRNNIEKLRKYYTIQELNTGCIFEYVNTKIQASTFEYYKKYRICYVLDNIYNRTNKDMVKIFKIDFD